MANIDFEDIKQKVTDTAGTIVEMTGRAAKAVAGKAQDTAKRTKINAQIAAERDGLKKKYMELGKLYYEKYAGNTDPDFAGTVSGIEAGLEHIAAKKKELEDLAASKAAEAAPEEPAPAAEPAEPAEPAETAEPAEPAEADHIVDEIEKTVEAEAEVAANAAEEAAEESARNYEDAVSTVNMPNE